MITLSLTQRQAETLALVLDWAIETGFLDVEKDLLVQYSTDIATIQAHLDEEG